MCVCGLGLRILYLFSLCVFGVIWDKNVVEMIFVLVYGEEYRVGEVVYNVFVSTE